MSARKCPKCGLVSFATQVSCKRCQSRAVVPHEKVEPAPSVVIADPYDAEPRRGFSPLRVLLFILLIALPLWYYTQWGISSAATERADDEKKQEELRSDRSQCPNGFCPKD